ncbi:MAG: tripartite tricarboxylate transporter substrate binding protein [Betaproteobacteria bacterium]|nr:tripartite tricarboxylate transporter substrate binding protein [Betaproteobacteria bacterium]
MKGLLPSLLTAVLGTASLAPAHAAEPPALPRKPVTLIVPQAAGGANDAIARILVQRLAEQTGVQWIVDNRPGAGGNIGTALAARARADGQTLLLTVNSAHVINPALYRQTGFDPIRDFEPVTPVATAGYVLVANPSFPAVNINELVAQAKRQPGKIMIGSAGNGTLNHLIGEMLGRAAGIDMVHVPYKGASAAVTDLLSGQVQVSVQSLPSAIAFIGTGKLRVLGVVNETRVAALPNVPTIGETIPGFGSTPWYGVFAPAGTPPAIVSRLHHEIVKAIAAPETVEKLASKGCEPFTSSPTAFAQLVAADLPRWAKIVRESGATID